MADRVSISLHERNLEILRAKYDEYQEKKPFKESFNSWVNHHIALYLDKIDWLENNMKSISYGGIVGDTLLLADSSRKEGDQAIEVRLTKNNRPICSKCPENPTDCMHAIYAAARPELAQIEVKSRKK